MTVLRENGVPSTKLRYRRLYRAISIHLGARQFAKLPQRKVRLVWGSASTKRTLLLWNIAKPAANVKCGRRLADAALVVDE